jgi:Luciferase-like monooxygenase
VPAADRRGDAAGRAQPGAFRPLWRWFVATGPDDGAVAAETNRVRARVALYASTRTYLSILALHGLEELNRALHALTVAGHWQEMPALVSDDVVRIFAACGTYGEIAQLIENRWGGAADSIDLSFPPETPVGLQREILTDVHLIPQAFIGFSTDPAPPLR